MVELIYGALAQNPRHVGKGLRFELEGLHSARRGDYRVIYRIDESIVMVVAIEHRADAYPLAIFVPMSEMSAAPSNVRPL